ncbi:MAG: exo-alpha-sialidase [Thermoplasmata archaeon]|nr:exo-alpha-sialidase [Thermoplasmata archaeon]
MISFNVRGALTIVVTMAVALSMVLLSAAPVADARNVKWKTPVVVAEDARYMTLDLVTGDTGTYILSWEHPAGRVLLSKSYDGGATWDTAVDVFGMPIWGTYPSMCVEPNGDADTILVASGPNYVAKSVDSGATFQRLADVPMPDYDTWYCPTAIGTNASWFGGDGEDDIYFVGGFYVGIPWTGRYVLHFSMSHDGGSSWTTPVVVSTEDYESLWPEVLSDGERLYVFHSVANSMNLHIKYSDDWGQTWHDGGDIATAEGAGGIAALKVQPIDDKKAFITVWDVYGPYGTGFARCGYFMYDDMSFKETFRVDDPDWHFGMFGLNVEMESMSEFNIAWIDQAPDGTYTIMFANSLPKN